MERFHFFRRSSILLSMSYQGYPLHSGCYFCFLFTTSCPGHSIARNIYIMQVFWRSEPYRRQCRLHQGRRCNDPSLPSRRSGRGQHHGRRREVLLPCRATGIGHYISRWSLRGIKLSSIVIFTVIRRVVVSSESNQANHYMHYIEVSTLFWAFHSSGHGSGILY